MTTDYESARRNEKRWAIPERFYNIVAVILTALFFYNAIVYLWVTIEAQRTTYERLAADHK